MPIGHSTPISTPAGFLAGLIAGEITQAIMKELDADPRTTRIASQVTHFAASTVVSGAINTVLGDVGVGYAATATTAVGGALVQPEIFKAIEAAGNAIARAGV